MTWTYSGDPSASNRDLVRFLVGDTDATDQQLTDEELAALVAQEGSAYRAAVAAAHALAARYARRADKSVGDLQISYGQLQQHYGQLAAQLQRRANQRSGRPVLTGGTISGMREEERDRDRVAPAFHRGQFDHPGTPPASDAEDPS